MIVTFRWNERRGSEETTSKRREDHHREIRPREIHGLLPSLSKKLIRESMKDFMMIILKV